MGQAVNGSIVRFAAATALALFGLFGVGSAAAGAGPFAGQNGKLATIESPPDSGTFLGTLSPSGAFDPIYEERDFNLAGASVDFSPDGSRIALSVGWRPTQLAIARPSSRHLRYVPTEPIQAYDPFWSKSGRIVFAGKTLKGTRAGTYSIRPDGSGLRRMSDQVFLAVGDHGRYVGGGSSAFGHYLDLRDPRGERLRVLARSRNHFFVGPEFSRNGRWIVYQRYLDPPGKQERSGDRLGDVFVVSADGTERRRLTFSGRDRYPTFSPDGRWVAFIRHNPKDLTSNVFVTRSDGSGKVRRITGSRSTYYTELSWGRR